VSVQILPWTFALHTSVQSPNTSALQHWFGKNASPLLSAVLQTRLTAALCHCKHTFGHLLSIPVCIQPTPVHCIVGFSKKDSPLLSVALQTRHSAGLNHCKYTYGHLLSIQMCSHQTPKHYSTGIGKKHSPLLSAALQTRLSAGLSHCKYTYGHLLSIQMCSHQTPMHWNWQKALPTAECCSANQTDSSLVSVQILPWTFALHTSVQSPNTNALQHWFEENAVHC